MRGKSTRDIITLFRLTKRNCLVRLLDLTADFKVKTNAKLTPNFKLREKSKLVLRAVRA